jgi:hypothetical protein
MRHFHQRCGASPSPRPTPVLRSPQVVLPHSTILFILSAPAITHIRTVTLTSETVRNTSGPSSVVILFTESEWHRIVLCVRFGRAGDSLEHDEAESNVAISAPTSKTLTRPSRAAVALHSCAHSSVYGSTGENEGEDDTHSLVENGSIFAEKMLSQCPVET